MAIGDYRFTFSTLKKPPGWTGTSITPKTPPKYDWTQAQTGAGYSRGTATPVVGKVDPSRGGGGWITSFKNDDDVFLRMQNGGAVTGVPSDILKAYLKRNPNATLETIPKEILVGTTLRRATDEEDPNSRLNQINREIAALHKNHPDEVISPLERAGLVKKYGQDALADYDKVYPASATLADTAGSDPATVGHPKSYAGQLTGNTGVVASPVNAQGGPIKQAVSGDTSNVQNTIDDLNASNKQLVTDWQNRILGGGVGVGVQYNPADMIRAGNERVLANAQALNQRQKLGNDWLEQQASRELQTLETSGPRWGGGMGLGGDGTQIQAARRRLEALQAQNQTGAFAPVGRATGSSIPTNSWQPGYSAFWGGGWR